MPAYTVYSTTSGEILRNGTCNNADVSLQAGEGETAIGSFYNDDNKYYDFDSSSFLDRPIMGIEISSKKVAIDQEVIITGIPAGTTFLYSAGSETIDDGQVEWSSNVSGGYEIILSNFPYQTEVFSIEVTA